MTTERRRGSWVEKPPAPIFEHFHSFKEFMQLQADTLEPGVAVQLYDQYKYDFKVFSSRQLFLQSQNRGFVYDRYDPERMRELCLHKLMHCRTSAASFLSGLDENEYNSLNLEFKLCDGDVKSKISFGQSTTAARIIGSILPSVERSRQTMKEDGSGGGETSNEQGLALEAWFCTTVANNKTLVLKKLPADVTTRMLECLCADVAGFRGATLIPACLLEENRVSLAKDAQDAATDAEQSAIQHAFSESYVRAKGGILYPLQTAWLEFDSEETCSAAETILDQKPIGEVTTAKPQRLRPKQRRINVTSIATHERLQKDLLQAKNLIDKLDTEFATYTNHPQVDLKGEDVHARPPRNDDDDDNREDEKKDDDENNMADELKQEAGDSLSPNPFLQYIKDLPLMQALDLCILYLRRVHFADFYGGRICWSAREFVECCGSATVRLSVNDSDVEVIEDQAVIMTPEDSILFDKRIDTIMRIPYLDFLVEINESHRLFMDAWNSFSEENTILVDSEKYRCGICKKLFKGATFVHKHLKNKHQDEITDLIKDCNHKLLNEAFEADDAKLLLFVHNSSDYMRVFPTHRPSAGRESGGYGPTRRVRSAGPRSSLLERSSFRDWDAPRSRLEEKAAGGNFRTMVRYDDL